MMDDLADAIADGDVSAVSAALRADPSIVAARTSDGDTLLHVAAWQKQIAIIGAIFAHHPDVNARGRFGRTPLHYAVHQGDMLSPPIVDFLLAHGADPTIRDDGGFTAEDWAKAQMSDGLPQVLAALRASSRRGTP